MFYVSACVYKELFISLIDIYYDDFDYLYCWFVVSEFLYVRVMKYKFLFWLRFIVTANM